MSERDDHECGEVPISKTEKSSAYMGDGMEAARKSIHESAGRRSNARFGKSDVAGAGVLISNLPNPYGASKSTKRKES